MQALINLMKNQSGLTLIELMVTTAIMVIIITTAIPAFKGLFENKNIPQIASIFEKSIKLARTEAVNRNTEVNVKPKEESGNGDWSQGWYLEYIPDDGDPDTDDKPVLIRTFPAIPGNLTTFKSSDNIKDGFTIRANGQLKSAAGTFSLKSPTNCAAGSYTLSLLVSGTIKKAESACP